MLVLSFSSGRYCWIQSTYSVTGNIHRWGLEIIKRNIKSSKYWKYISRTTTDNGSKFQVNEQLHLHQVLQ
jgi:hypothetical protein